MDVERRMALPRVLTQSDLVDLGFVYLCAYDKARRDDRPASREHCGLQYRSRAAAAGDDLDVLRMENLDIDIAPPAEAMDATRDAIGQDEANSWLPFTGRDDLKEAAAAHIERRGGPRYDGPREIVISVSRLGRRGASNRHRARGSSQLRRMAA